jgi:hypothetical protein
VQAPNSHGSPHPGRENRRDTPLLKGRVLPLWPRQWRWSVQPLGSKVGVTCVVKAESVRDTGRCVLSAQPVSGFEQFSTTSDELVRQQYPASVGITEGTCRLPVTGGGGGPSQRRPGSHASLLAGFAATMHPSTGWQPSWPDTPPRASPRCRIRVPSKRSRTEADSAVARELDLET